MAKRVKREHAASERGRADPRASEYDLWPIVVQSGIRNGVGEKTAHIRFIQYVKAHCSHSVCALVFKLRARLPGLIDDIWRWETVDSAVAHAGKTLLDHLRTSAEAPCVCGGAWAAAVTQSFLVNHINVHDICQSVLRALSHGRSPTAPTVTLAGSSCGEGKSRFF